jgi:hypothetical protein
MTDGSSSSMWPTHTRKIPTTSGRSPTSWRTAGTRLCSRTFRRWTLTGFNARKVPSTDAAVEQKLHTMQRKQPLESWFLEALTSGDLPIFYYNAEGVVTASYLIMEEFSRDNRLRQIGKNKVGSVLTAIADGSRQEDNPQSPECRPREAPNRPTLFSLPSLEEARRRLLKHLGMKPGEVSWGAQIEWACERVVTPAHQPSVVGRGPDPELYDADEEAF